MRPDLIPNLLGPQLQLWPRHHSTFLGFGHTPSGGTTAAVWMAAFKDFKAKFTQRSWLILTRVYLGADTLPAPPHPHPRTPKCSENYSWQSGWPVTNLTLLHTPSPPAQEWAASGPCLPLPSTKWATQTRFISPVLHSMPDRKDVRNLAGHFPTSLIPDRMCILWIPKSWPRDITSIPAKAICYSLLFKLNGNSVLIFQHNTQIFKNWELKSKDHGPSYPQGSS